MSGQVVSLVLPVYNERDNLEPLLAEIAESLPAVEHEVIAVDDGSTDGSLACLRALAIRYPTLRVVALQVHAGQSAAIVAGFDVARGSIIVTMDADGQNDPRDVQGLVAQLNADASVAAVVGYRSIRRDSVWRRFQSRVANAVRSQLTGDGIRDTGCSLKAMRTNQLRRVPRFDGMHRFLPALIQYHGGRVLERAVNHRPRWSGRSKYGMWARAVRGVRDTLGVRWLGKRALRFTAQKNGGVDGAS